MEAITMASHTPRSDAPARGGAPQRAGLPPFDRVVEEHGPAVLRFCASELGADRAEDCFQEAMMAALRAYAQLRDPAAVRAWLFSIAARKATDAHRAHARAAQPTDDIDSRAVTKEVSAPADEALWEQVRALPEKQRQAVMLRYRGDLTYGEIAEVMQISNSAARRNVFEGLTQLRKEG